MLLIATSLIVDLVHAMAICYRNVMIAKFSSVVRNSV